jgi:hypothetical protein
MHNQATRALIADDHSGGGCGAGAGGLAGPLLGGHCVQRAAPQEELEEHLQPVRGGEGAFEALSATVVMEPA